MYRRAFLKWVIDTGAAAEMGDDVMEGIKKDLATLELPETQTGLPSSKADTRFSLYWKEPVQSVSDLSDDDDDSVVRYVLDEDGVFIHCKGHAWFRFSMAQSICESCNNTE